MKSFDPLTAASDKLLADRMHTKGREDFELPIQRYEMRGGYLVMCDDGEFVLRYYYQKHIDKKENDILSLYQRIADLERQVMELRKYADHEPDCNKNIYANYIDTFCNCGLDKALGGK